MTDDDDVEFFALVSPVGGVLGVFCFIVFVFVAITAYQNNRDCGQKHCDDGKKSALIHHECICVEVAR